MWAIEVFERVKAERDKQNYLQNYIDKLGK